MFRGKYDPNKTPFQREAPANFLENKTKYGPTKTAKSAFAVSFVKRNFRLER